MTDKGTDRENWGTERDSIKTHTFRTGVLRGGERRGYWCLLSGQKEQAKILNSVFNEGEPRKYALGQNREKERGYLSRNTLLVRKGKKEKRLSH